MAAGDERISQLGLLAAEAAAPNDLTVVVDVSASLNKRMTLAGLGQAALAFAPAGSLDLSLLNQASTTKLGGSVIAAGTITPNLLAPNSLTAEQLAPNSVGASELASNAVDASAVLDGAITEPKLATGAISARALAASAVATAALATGAVTYTKLQNTISGDVILGRASASPGTIGEIHCTAIGRDLLAAADAAAQRGLLELGPLATADGTWAPGSSFSGTASGTNTGDQTITLSGAVIGSGTGPIATTLAASVVDEGHFVTGAVSTRALGDGAVAAAKLASNSATIVSDAVPSGSGAFVGQGWFAPSSTRHWIWTGGAWGQSSGITALSVPANGLLVPEVTYPDPYSATITLASPARDAGMVWIGPETGSAEPSFRRLVGPDLPPATNGVRGAIRLGEGLLADVDGLASIAPATALQRGGVRVPGGALSVDPLGHLIHADSVLAAGTYTKVSTDQYGHIVAASTLAAADIPDLGAEKITSGFLSGERIGIRSVGRTKLSDYSIAYIQESDPGTSEDLHNGCLWLRESTAQLRMWNGNSWFPVGFGSLIEENLRYCGTFNATTGAIAGLTALGVNESFAIGQAIPSATDPRAGVYLVCTTAGSGVGVLNGTTFDPGDWILCNGATGGWIRVDSALGGGGGGTDYLDDLLDVATTAAAAGDVLERTGGGTWANARPKTIFTPITAGQTPTTGQILQEQLLVSDTTTDPAIFLRRADGVVVRIAGVGSVGAPAAASTTVSGLVELATTAEVQTGTDAARAVTPAALKATLDGRLASATVPGLIELATAGEVSAGTDAVRAVTPSTLAPLLAAKFTTASASETAQGIIELATPAEVSAGTDTVRAVTPAGLKPLLDAKFTTAAATQGAQGLVELATSVEVNAGTDAVRAVTPSTLAARTATEDRAGLIELATLAEVNAGTDTIRAVTPATLLSRLNSRFGALTSYAKGTILAGASAGSLGVLEPGSDGQILEANAASALGVRWVARPGGVTSVSGAGGGPISVANPTTTPVISVAAATTLASGVVQLNTATNSTSTNQAATPSAVKAAYDLAAAALPVTGGTLTGNLGSSATGFVRLPNGTTAQRPASPLTGMARWNTTLAGPEIHDGATWQTMASTAFVRAAQVESGPLAGFRNAVINGDFRYWFDGDSFLAPWVNVVNAPTRGYTAERWRAFENAAAGTAKMQVNRTAISLDFYGLYPFEGNPENCAGITVTGAGSGEDYCQFSQHIENVRTFAGRTATVSFMAWASASRTLGLEFEQKFGSGGSPDVQAIGSQTFSLTPTPARFTATVQIPSVAGRVIGNGSSLQLNLWLCSGNTARPGFPANPTAVLARTRSGGVPNQNGTFYITEVQVEPGPIRTPFEWRPDQVETALCQRYKYRPTSNIPGFPNIAGRMFKILLVNGFGIGQVHAFPTAMRVAPSLFWTDLAGNPEHWTLGGTTHLQAPPAGGLHTTRERIFCDLGFSYGPGIQTVEAVSLRADAEF